MIRTKHTRTLLRHALLGLGAAATVIFAAGQIRPVFVGGAALGGQLVEPLLDDDVALVRVPLTNWLWMPREAAARARSGRPGSLLWRGFDADRRAFAQDLLATGHLGASRAWRIADAAVRQAYTHRIPPALVLGVMLTENTTLKPTARSNVGAQGLMQIMPRLWKPALGHRFGRDLSDDATNLRYGIYILRHMHDRVPGTLGPDASYRTALLRYNGCVRGTNTRDCYRYPDTVERYVLRNARATCAGRSFRDCVVMPLYMSRHAVPQPVARVAAVN